MMMTSALMSASLAAMLSLTPPVVSKPPVVPRTTPKHALATQTLYVANSLTSSVTLYPAGVNDPAPIATITSGISQPSSLWVDGSGTLYVANKTGGPNSAGSVTEYKSGQTTPFLTITDGVFHPGGVAVDASGTLYVAQAQNAPPEVIAYPAGSTHPHGRIQLTNIGGIFFAGGMNFDASGNLYVGFFLYRHLPARVIELAPGLKSKRDLHLQRLDGVDTNPDFTRDSAGNLYFGTSAPNIYVYHAGSRHPFRSMPVEVTGQITTDSAGNLYVPTGFLGVDVYAPGSNTPFATVSQGTSDPSATFVH